MLTLHYFASVRELTRRNVEQLEQPESVQSVADLIAFLAARDSASRAALAGDVEVLVAVNQTVVSRDAPLAGNEEVAFFPPMTGG